MNNNITKYPITGVALGPGDPELITVKGLKALQTADIIYYAASKVEEGNIASFSKQILDTYELKALCKPLLFVMNGKNRTRYYEQAVKQLKEDYRLGLRIVVVTEGDLSFYSTFGYIMKLAKIAGIPVRAVPGVPAFIAAMARVTTPLVDGNRTLLNMSAPTSFDEIKKELETDKAIVIMKMKVIKGWYDFLKGINRDFFYFEKIGTCQEYFTDDYNDLRDRTIPYFSLIVFPTLNQSFNHEKHII